MKEGSELSVKLSLDGTEIPVSGQLDRVDEHEVVVYLDDMIAEYEAALKEHLARAQLLDVVL